METAGFSVKDFRQVKGFIYTVIEKRIESDHKEV